MSRRVYSRLFFTLWFGLLMWSVWFERTNPDNAGPVFHWVGSMFMLALCFSFVALWGGRMLEHWHDEN